jgi:hypothetical protein
MGHACAVYIDGGNGRIQASLGLSLIIDISEYSMKEGVELRTLLGEPDGEWAAEWVEDPEGFREEGPDIGRKLYAEYKKVLESKYKRRRRQGY